MAEKQQSYLISELTTILEDSCVLQTYSRPKTKITFNFLKFADNSIQLFLITVSSKKRECYVVFDSTIYCYAFYEDYIPLNIRLMVWGRVYNRKWLVITKWTFLCAKKLCYEFF